jgi:hypothetical protein
MKHLDTKTAGKYARGAALNAHMNNIKNMALYSADEIKRAVTALDLLDSAYANTGQYINYRPKFISVTVKNPVARDNILVKQLLDLFAEQGSQVVSTPQGIIVRLA